MSGNPSVGGLLRDAQTRLTAAGWPSPGADARLLLAHVMGIPTTGLAVAGFATGAQVTALDALIRRRLAGEPLQHLTGCAYFRHETLKVGPGVFIPRPETEGLVQLVLDWLPVGPSLVVDLGTGSGAIALALAREAPEVRVIAVERSETSNEYALLNLAGTDVELRRGDWAHCLGDLNGVVDVVVTNPPYVPSGSDLPRDVEGRDPDDALFAGVDGLDALRQIVPLAERLLRSGGLLACEHDDTHQFAAPALLQAAEFEDVVDHADLAGRPRYVTGTRAAGAQ